MNNKTIVLTGGGTAGHIMPNIALLPELKKYFDKIYYLGSANSMEEKIMQNYKEVIFVKIPTTKFIRKFTIKNLAIPFKLVNSVCKTKKILKTINPDIIFCKGGFVSVPVALAGKKLKIPVISHESDFSMGLANKIILKNANIMCTSFEDTCKNNKKVICTGSPIRKELFYGNKEIAKKSIHNFDEKLNTIMFFGGSSGSKTINDMVFNSIEELTKRYNVIHIVGKNNGKKINCPHYFQLEFTYNIQDYFALSDLVVCRGGANSLFELLALNKPMLIIPLSKAQSRGDQIENAIYFKNKKYADILLEEDISTNNILSKINNTIANKEKYINAMKTAKQINSNAQIIDIITKNIK